MDTQLTDRLQTSFSGEHKSYLADNYPAAYATMQKKGELDAYLQEIGKQAAEMYLRLKGEMRAKADETSMERAMPAVYAELMAIRATLEES